MRSLRHALTTPALLTSMLTSTLVASALVLSSLLGAGPAAGAAHHADHRTASHAAAWTRRTPGDTRSVGVRAPFVVASFNTLGDSHTSAHGDKPSFPDGVTRMHWDTSFILRNHLDLVGFQELQHPQARAFVKGMGGRYELFSGSRDTENSIAWDAHRFALVAGTTQPVPYFSGNIRHMPVVLLRDRATGQELYVMNVHNPADTRAHRGNEKWRRRAMSRELALVEQLRTHGLPVIVTGDMNEHREGFCTFTSTGDLHAAAGGDHAGGCHAPSRFNGIDWIFGSTGVSFSDFHVDRSTLDSHASDHGVPIARVS